jgi:hypothetical protein
MVTRVAALQLQPNPGSIDGVVLLEGATDHAGTTVSVLGTSLSATTATDGSFSIGDVPPGIHTLSAAATGFVDHDYPPVLVRAGQASTVSQTLLAIPRGGISGTVALSGRSDASGVLVSVDGTSFAVVTGPSGEFEFAGLPEGTYSITLSHPDYKTGSVTGVVVAEGQTADVSSTPLQTNPGSLVGRVLLEGATDHSGTLIAISGTSLSATTAADGSFTLGDVPPGVATVTASATGYEAHDYGPVLVSAGTQTALGDTTLAVPRGGLDGSVVLEGRTDHSGVLVSIQGTSFATITGPSGEFAFTGLVAAQYTVVASHPEFATTTLSDQTVVGGESTAVGALTLTANPGAISGFVFLEGASDHTGILVSVTGTSYTAVTAADGSYTISGVPAGTWPLSAEATDHDRHDFSPAIVSPGATTTAPTATLVQKRGVIAGVVTLEGQTSHAGVRIDLQGSSFFTTSDATGAYELRVPTGNYPGVTFTKDQYAPGALTQTITVTDFGTANLVAVELNAVSNDIFGKVTRFQSTDHSGSMVELMNLADAVVDTVIRVKLVGSR